MLVKYKGTQSAISMSINGTMVRLVKNDDTLLNKEQVASLKNNDYFKRLLADDQLKIDDLSSKDKTELEQIALSNQVDLPAKSTVKSIRALLNNGGVPVTEDEDDEDTDPNGAGGDVDPNAGTGADK